MLVLPIDPGTQDAGRKQAVNEPPNGMPANTRNERAPECDWQRESGLLT